MSKKDIEKFILENLFNNGHVLYNSKGINITRDWPSDYIEQVNRDGLLILPRACQSVHQTKEIATRTSEDLREILKRKERPTTTEYLEKKATAYLSWIDDISEQLQKWSNFFPGEGRKSEQIILKQ